MEGYKGRILVIKRGREDGNKEFENTIEQSEEMGKHRRARDGVGREPIRLASEESSAKRY